MANINKLLAVVLVCFMINAKNGESYGTIGFDVHHRYSDMVKNFLDPEGLPEKGTMDYYNAMAHRDHLFKARRLQAGGSDGSGNPSPSSNASILTFYGGNDTFQLSRLGFLHYSIVTVGTPPLVFLVALDTGSDLFWLPCDCTNCARSLNLSSAKPFELNIYSPSNSSTSSPVPCNSTLCGPTRGCAVRRNACAYQEVYLSANTSSTGILVDDVIHMGTEDTPQGLINAPITLGCGIIQTGSFLRSGGINGLLGLGMDSISVPSILSSRGLVGSNSLAMCFGPNGLGRIEFGYTGSPDYRSTPFNLESSHPTYNVSVTQVSVGTNATDAAFTAVFDSGTSFAFLNDPVYSMIGNAFDSLVTEPRYRETNLIFEYCYSVGANQRTYAAPHLNLTMGGGDIFHVTDSTIVITRTDGGLAYCLGMIKSEDINIIGQNFMTGYRIVFDRDEMVLRWKESDCMDLIISTETLPGNNSSTTPPSFPFPGATSRNRTLTPPSPPPSSTNSLSGNNAARLSSIPTLILMTMISISFHHFMVL